MELQKIIGICLIFIGIIVLGIFGSADLLFQYIGFGGIMIGCSLWYCKDCIKEIEKEAEKEILEKERKKRRITNNENC